MMKLRKPSPSQVHAARLRRRFPVGTTVRLRDGMYANRTGKVTGYVEIDGMGTNLEIVLNGLVSKARALRNAAEWGMNVFEINPTAETAEEEMTEVTWWTNRGESLEVIKD